MSESKTWALPGLEVQYSGNLLVYESLQPTLGWRPSFVQLRGPVLVWYSDASCHVLNGVISLYDVEINDALPPGNPTPSVQKCFCVKSRESSTFFAPVSQGSGAAVAEIEKWLAMVRPHVNDSSSPSSASGSAPPSPARSGSNRVPESPKYDTLQRKIDLQRVSNSPLSGDNAGLEGIGAMVSASAEKLISRVGQHLTVGSQQKLLAQSGPSLFLRGIPGTELIELGWEHPAGSALAFRIGEIVAFVPPVHLQSSISYPSSWKAEADSKSPESPSNAIQPNKCYILGVVAGKVFKDGVFQKEFRIQVDLAGTIIEHGVQGLFKRPREVELLKWRRVTGPGSLLGKGAFGSVYSAVSSDGRPLAVKVLAQPIAKVAMNEAKEDAENADIDEDIDATTLGTELWAEISLMQVLQHPNIVRFLGAKINPRTGQLSIIMERVNGGSVKARLDQNGPLSEPVIKNYTRQILYGLRYLHSHGVVHRDIKSANLLLSIDDSGKETVKLADFGVSKKIQMDHATGGLGGHMGTVYLGGALGAAASKDAKARQRAHAALHATNLMTLTGTPFFMAPEVVLEDGYGRKADIWALGCTLIEMASGEQPWKGYNHAAALFAIGDPTKMPEIPASVQGPFKDFVLKCLTRDKAARPGVEELLEHPWLAQ